MQCTYVVDAMDICTFVEFIIVRGNDLLFALFKNIVIDWNLLYIVLFFFFLKCNNLVDLISCCINKNEMVMSCLEPPTL